MRLNLDPASRRDVVRALLPELLNVGMKRKTLVEQVFHVCQDPPTCTELKL